MARARPHYERAIVLQTRPQRNTIQRTISGSTPSECSKLNA